MLSTRRLFFVCAIDLQQHLTLYWPFLARPKKKIPKWVFYTAGGKL
jgi:hypothetical protein